MAQKQSVMFALGSVSKSPHHLEAIEASEFIWHETNYNARTTDEMLVPGFMARLQVRCPPRAAPFTPLCECRRWRRRRRGGPL